MEEHTGTQLPRIGLVGVSPIRTAGLEDILAHGIDFELVPLSALSALNDGGLELILVDASATDRLFELLAVFRGSRPQIRLVVLGGETDPAYIERVIGAGAEGYLPHNSGQEELRMAVEVVRDGSVWAPRKVLARLLEQARSKVVQQTMTRSFTRREQQVLKLLVLGRSNREIAQELEIDEGTVKAHMGRLMRKTGVANRIALSMRALEAPWIHSGQ